MRLSIALVANRVVPPRGHPATLRAGGAVIAVPRRNRAPDAGPDGANRPAPRSPAASGHALS
jgi:hypothetical protein